MNNKAIVVSDKNDSVLIYMIPDCNGNYVICEPADGSIKAEVFNDTEPVFKDDGNGNMSIDRSKFILDGTSIESI